MDDEQTTGLLRQARAGSTDALDALYRRYAGRLLALIRLRMGPEMRSRLESRDVLQSCLLKSFERIDQFEHAHDGSLMAWFARIAENEIRDRIKFERRRRRDVRQELPLDAAPRALEQRVRSSLSRLILGERAAELERALDELPADYREVILLRKLEERSWDEIGARFGKSPDACRMLLARAMTALTMRMEHG
ncbi:MAG TPA: RNA polymerase sigma factor [Candidatus Polarisedimenticolaceae bacterium]|nr:RNA polymerase sigma factor [Candidatus Polarisedimenticolaceae bacterium]